MRRIAAEIGCDPMAIYRHFPNREALLDAVADLAIADAIPPDAAPRPPADTPPGHGEGEKAAANGPPDRGPATRVRPGAGLRVASADSAMAEAGSWDVRVRALLTQIRTSALQHPGIAIHIASRPPLGHNGRKLAAILHQDLADAGLRPEDVARAGQALIAYTAAALRMAVLAGERDERWHQVTEAIGHELPVVGSPEQFDYGLRLLLNGIKAEV